MGELDRNKMRRTYKNNALRVLLRHPEPSLDDVKRQVCYRGNCPVGECRNPEGFKNNCDCGHVLNIKHIIDTANEYFDDHEKY